MCVAWKHVDGLDMVAVNFPFKNLSFRVVEVSLLNETVALDHDELFELGVVPVLTFCDAGLADVDADLSCIEGVYQLCEAATIIDVHLQKEGGLLVGQVAEIGAVELLGKATCRNLRYHKCLRLLGEGLKESDYFAEGGLVGDGAVAISTFIEH